MRVDQFDFHLPEDLIALHPASPRDAARLLVVGTDGSLTHAQVCDLPRYLRTGDALVANDTRVIAARLRGRRVGRGDAEPKIELLLHRRVAADGFLAFARPARKIAVGDRLRLGETLEALATRCGEGGEIEIRFTLQG